MKTVIGVLILSGSAAAFLLVGCASPLPEGPMEAAIRNEQALRVQQNYWRQDSVAEQNREHEFFYERGNR